MIYSVSEGKKARLNAQLQPPLFQQWSQPLKHCSTSWGQSPNLSALLPFAASSLHKTLQCQGNPQAKQVSQQGTSPLSLWSRSKRLRIRRATKTRQQYGACGCDAGIKIATRIIEYLTFQRNNKCQQPVVHTNSMNHYITGNNGMVACCNQP